jgi:hypothetical protein
MSIKEKALLDFEVGMAGILSALAPRCIERDERY